MAVAVGQRCVVRIQITDIELRNARDIMATIVSPQGVDKCQKVSFDEVSGVVYATIDVDSAGSWSMWLCVRFANEVVYTPSFVFAEVSGDVKPCDVPYVVDVQVQGESVTVTPPHIDVDGGGDVSREEFDALSNEVESLRNDIGNISAEMLYPTTYAELVALRKAKALVAGAYYRITDYQTTTKQSNTRSAGHPFDIIVLALDEETLSENAHAIQREGDTYFANSNLKAWRLKYSLEGDANRFAWGTDAAREQSWSCAWGVLESKPNSDASSNYEQATIDGKLKYLYRPAEPTSHLQGKQFYRDIVISSITSPEGLIYEADSAPSQSEDYYDYPYEIRVKTASGEQVALLVQEYDNYYYDERNMDYYVQFGDSYTEVDGVYHLTPESGIEDWWEYVVGGSIDETEREYYDGSVDSLYYVFDAILPKSSKTVTEVTDKVHIYKTGGTIDTIAYRSYIAPEDGGKGVIYGMTDEYGNYCNFDFKNIQFKVGEDWFYGFGATDKTLSGTSFNNTIECSNGKNIARVIFKDTAKWNRVRTEFSGTTVFGGVVQGTIIENVSSGFTSITANGPLYGCLMNNNTRGTITIDGRMTGVTISGASDNTYKGEFFYCSFFGRGSFAMVDSNGNNKKAQSIRAYFGNSSSNVKLVHNGTIGTTTGTDIELVAPNWGNSAVEVDITNYASNIKIAKNSAGVVKVWNDADKA